MHAGTFLSLLCVFAPLREIRVNIHPANLKPLARFVGIIPVPPRNINEDRSMQRLVLIAILLIPATLHASPTVVKFKLNAIDGKPWSLDSDAKDKKAVVVVFIGTQCPVNNAYMPKLVELEKQYRDK